jgi:L-fucose isomerase-like protein
LRIFIATGANVSDDEIDEARQGLINKFPELSLENFVNDNPDIFWFISGGAEHKVLQLVSSGKRYCLITSADNNAWAAATEIKANLNEKGVKSKIFNIGDLTSLNQLNNFLHSKFDKSEINKLGIIGKSSDWLVASNPDPQLLLDVLNIEIVNIEFDEIANWTELPPNPTFYNKFKHIWSSNIEDAAKIQSALLQIKQKYELDSLTINCFQLIKENSQTACLALSVLNSNELNTICEGDICAAAAAIVSKNIIGKIPWMANLTYVGREYASFAHCTVPLSMTESYEIDTHFESGIGTAINAKIKDTQVTVFRIDEKLESCFIALGQIIGDASENKVCRTSVKIKLSTKSLFLLREFPLGNHHMILFGDYSDIIAEYFTEKGFKIF